MNKRLQNIFYRHEKELAGWYDNIKYYQEHFITPYNPYWEDIREKPIDIEVLLHRVLEIFIGYQGGAGSWKWQESLDYGTGFSTGVVSQQISHFYTLGVYKDSIYFETPIAYPESIHKMFDKFVQGIADYSRLGIFTYNKNEIFDDAIIRSYRPLLKEKIKGQLSDLLRDYFIAKAELDGDFGFGFLEITWPLNKFTMYQFLTAGCRAFETIHSLNVELWKKSKTSRPGDNYGK